MFQLCIDSQYSSQQLTIVWSLIHHCTQPIFPIFSRVRVLHLDRLKEGTWLHSFDWMRLIWKIVVGLFQAKKKLHKKQIIKDCLFLLSCCFVVPSSKESSSLKKRSLQMSPRILKRSRFNSISDLTTVTLIQGMFTLCMIWIKGIYNFL